MTSLTQNLNLTRATGSNPDFGLGLIRALRRLAGNLGRVFASIAAAQHAVSDYQRLNRRTDAQLSAQGLCRADVARSVFERNFD